MSDLSCLGCGQVRQPVTRDAVSHAYLCDECVQAIRLWRNPDAVGQLLSDHFANLLMPRFNGWDDPIRYAEARDGATVTQQSAGSSIPDSYRERLAALCHRIILPLSTPPNQLDLDSPEAERRFAAALRDYTHPTFPLLLSGDEVFKRDARAILAALREPKP